MKFEVIGLNSYKVYDTIEANSRKELKEKFKEIATLIYKDPKIRENLTCRYSINHHRESIVKKYDKKNSNNESQQEKEK